MFYKNDRIVLHKECYVNLYALHLITIFVGYLSNVSQDKPLAPALEEDEVQYCLTQP